MLRQFDQIRMILANIKHNVMMLQKDNEELRKAYEQLKCEKSEKSE